MVDRVIYSDRHQVAYTNDVGESELINAIDPRWALKDARDGYARFYRLEREQFDTADQSEWMKNMQKLEADIDHLRTLDHHRFWSTLIYDSGMLAMIDSYLANCPRYHLHPQLIDAYFLDDSSSIAQRMRSVHRKMLLVIVRMFLQQDSEQSALSESYFARIIYDHKIAEIVRLIDICSVYGIDNRRLLQTTFEPVFAVQPKFVADLHSDTKMMLKLFDKYADRAEHIAAAGHRQRVYHTPTTDTDRNNLIELCDQIVDLVFTLNAFVDAVPLALDVFHQCQMTERLPSLVERVWTSLETELDLFQPTLSGFEINSRSLISKLEYFKQGVVDLFRQLVNANCLTTPAASADSFLTLITSVLNCENFMFIYDELYPIDNDLRNFETDQQCDSSQVQYVRNALESIAINQNVKLMHKLERRGLLQGLGHVDDNVELQSSITAVHDILPHFSVEYIHLCLRHYAYDSQRVIDELLTVERLPIDLRRAQRLQLHAQSQLPYRVDEDEQPPPCVQLYMSRQQDKDINMAYDDDAEACRQDDDDVVVPGDDDDEQQQQFVPLATGKKHGTTPAVGTSGTIDAVKQIKNRYQRYYYVQQTTDGGADGDVYDDEYDDTYDGVGVDPFDGRDQETLVTRIEQINNADAEVVMGENSHKAPPPVAIQYTGTYLGGRDRQLKERRGGKSWKTQARRKAQSGMFF